jgi:predicted DNA-binding transcriptional regulator AlpA
MIHQLEAAERLPRRVRIGVRAVGRLEGEVQAWLSERVQRRGFVAPAQR